MPGSLPALSNSAFRPRSPLLSAARALSPAAVAAGQVALERQRGQRVRRLVDTAGDVVRQRRQPRCPRMGSLVLGSGGRLTWRGTAAPPPPGPSAAVVAPLAMATCDMDRPLGLGVTPFPLPLHLGHECVGRVTAVGADVRSVAVGDVVAVPFQISCGTCAACRAGLTGSCRAVPPISMYGFGLAGGAWGGAFSELVAVPYADAMLVPLPAGVDPVAVASVGDTLSDAYRHLAPHLDRVRRDPDGPRIIIVGATEPEGPFSPSVPFYASQLARALVPEAEVLVVDARAWVRAAGAAIGVEVLTLLGLRGRTAPLVIDCSASPRGLSLAVRATAPDGVCSCAGNLHASLRIPAALMFGRSITLAIGRSHVRTVMPEVLDLVAAGRIHPEKVTTTLAAFQDAPDALREHLLSESVKTVLVRTA